MANEASADTVSGDTLADLLARARARLLRDGARHQTQRGATRSLNGVLLRWKRPEGDRSLPGQWRHADVDWYLRTFVAARPANDPAALAEPGAYVFPYTYAARARFWDGGWGYLVALLAALRATGVSLATLTQSADGCSAGVAALGERLHAQTVLSLLALHPPRTLARWVKHPELVEALCAQWRRDLLAGAIADIGATPESRRAVVSALCYPHLEEQLQPRMALPPYQLFQLLPGEPGAPLDSIHVHRSLDVDGGAPLDFYHDLAWLREASARLGRPVGSITIVAHNLHAYEAETDGSDGPKGELEPETIAHWLCRVTDGYAAGTGVPWTLLQQPHYQANIARIWARWQEEVRG